MWLADNLPEGFVEDLRIPHGVQVVADSKRADLLLRVAPVEDFTPTAASSWTYALVAPFPTVTDGVSYNDLERFWHGNPAGALKEITLLVSPQTRAVFDAYWTATPSERVRTVEAEAVLAEAWQAENTWAIIPFEAIDPHWKVLRVDGISPLDRFEDSQSAYPLSVQLVFTGQATALEWDLPTNRDPAKLSRLVMTGVTALARRTAETMEREGYTYPAQDIGPLLREADLTHISNEVSFKQDCLKPRPDLRFCSRPDYIELLEAVGADIIELTGNHNLDWGPEPYLETLAMYAERGWQTYGGGRDLNEAQAVLRVEHNGNRLAFLGCSMAGPSNAWAGDTTPGAAPCDLERMEQEVLALRSEGYLPVVTFQHFETDWYVPTTAQGMPDFRRMAKAGAVIVQGSQAHFPQTMTLARNEINAEPAFVHYGLGNLFFDQMQPQTIRQAFIDLHVFYEGRYLGVDLITTMLEDAARPRMMTPEERETFLSKVFELSDWSGVTP